MKIHQPLYFLLLFAFPAPSFSASPSPLKQEEEISYGVDLSFPIHRRTVSTNYPWLPHNVDPANNRTPRKYQGQPIQYLGNVEERYDEFIKGCHDFYPNQKRMCDSTERDRVAMALRQPSNMQNYTEYGFKKIKTPPAVWKLISEFWEANKSKDNWKGENWSKGNTYVNHWVSPTYMLDVGSGSLRGGGGRLKHSIWNAARDTLEEWTGEELTDCSLYGIRVYTEGAMLATHVDRLPLVSSAIVNVAQDLDEPWPIEVYSHDGKAYNVTMEPGDMVLYESHSVLHGRPFPMKGRYYANVFIHFEPVGHTLRHDEKMSEGVGGDVNKKYEESVKRRQGGHENHQGDVPSYIVPGTVDETKWRQQHPLGNENFTGQTEAHSAAREGDVGYILEIIDKKKDMVHTKDVNGWAPIHEATRGGHLEVVRTLVEKGGADVNILTGLNEEGESVLHMAIETHGEDHPLVDYLNSIGALMIGPDL